MGSQGHPSLTVEPVTPDRWPTLEGFFGRAGAYSGCWCTWWRVTSAQFEAGCRDGAVGNRERMSRLTADGEVPGLLAFEDGRAVGWVSLGPRPAFGRLLRSPVLRPERAVADPDDDHDDPAVWSVVCFWVPRRERGRGVAAALLEGAVRRATDAGARTLEAYPIADAGRARAAELYTGTLAMFMRAGFTEVRRRRPARPVVRRRLV